MNISASEDLAGFRRAVETYLHQDWTIDGNTLEEVFGNNEGLEGITEDVKLGAQILIDSELSEHELDQIMLGWGAGYEPEAEGFDDWREALREIVRLCDKHLKMRKTALD